MYYVSLTGIEAVKGIKGQNMPTNSNVITFNAVATFQKNRYIQKNQNRVHPCGHLLFL
jgi:hypothetical protein